MSGYGITGCRMSNIQNIKNIAKPLIPGPQPNQRPPKNWKPHNLNVPYLNRLPQRESIQLAANQILRRDPERMFPGKYDWPRVSRLMQQLCSLKAPKFWRSSGVFGGRIRSGHAKAGSGEINVRVWRPFNTWNGRDSRVRHRLAQNYIVLWDIK